MSPIGEALGGVDWETRVARANAPRGSRGTDAELAALELKPRVEVDPRFAIAPHVLEAASRWPTEIGQDDDGIDRLRCTACGQAVAVLGTSAPHTDPQQVKVGLPGTYRYDLEQLRGLVLAHLMQRHGWTREQTNG